MGATGVQQDKRGRRYQPTFSCLYHFGVVRGCCFCHCRSKAECRGVLWTVRCTDRQRHTLLSTCIHTHICALSTRHMYYVEYLEKYLRVTTYLSSGIKVGYLRHVKHWLAIHILMIMRYCPVQNGLNTRYSIRN